jgi:L-lactate dehydrogenase
MKKLQASKVAIIGAGNVGSTAAYTMAIRNVAAEISLIDVNIDKGDGEVMDINDGMCFLDTGCIKRSNFKDARNADVIVVTAGARQKPGETRLDLVEKNKKIMGSIFKSIGKLKPSTIVVLISNPVDILAHHVQRITKLAHSQVFGTGTALDTARLKTILGEKFNISPQNVHGYVLGEHGDSEFVAWSSVSIAGIPIGQIKGFSKKLAKKIEKQVRKEAYEIIDRKGATFYGIGLVVTDIVQAILLNQHVVLSVTTKLNKWNGVDKVYLGAPAVIGRNGIERHWPLGLTSEEKKKMEISASVVKKFL